MSYTASSHDEGGHEVVTTTEARQDNTLGVMRYVLGISLTLAVIAFIIVYAIYFWPA